MPGAQRSRLMRKIPLNGGFSSLEYRRLKKAIRVLLERPQNRIGLEGYRKHEHAWNTWLDQLIDCRLGKHFWGYDKRRRLDITRDRAVIGIFMGKIVARIVGRMRVKLRRQAERLNDHPAKHKDGVDTDNSNAGGIYDPGTNKGGAREREEEIEIPFSERRPTLTAASIAHNASYVKLMYVEGLDKVERKRLFDFICTRLAEPENLIGLREFGKDRKAWECWFDSFLTSAIEKDFLEGGNQRIWKLTCDDPTVIRNIMMEMVFKATASARKRLRHGRLVARGRQPRSDGNSDHSSTSSSKDTSESESESESEQESEPELELNLSGLNTEEMPHTTDEESTPENKPSFPGRTFSSGPPSLSMPRTFMTRITITSNNQDDTHYEAIKINTVISLVAFLDLLRDQNKIRSDMGIQSLEVEICGRKIDIDLLDPEAEWSWGLVLGILNYSGVGDGEAAYVEVRVQ